MGTLDYSVTVTTPNPPPPSGIGVGDSVSYQLQLDCTATTDCGDPTITFPIDEGLTYVSSSLTSNPPVQVNVVGSNVVITTNPAVDFVDGNNATIDLNFVANGNDTAGTPVASDTSTVASTNGTATINVTNAPDLTLNQVAVGFNISVDNLPNDPTVSVGEEFEYVVDYSCLSLTTACGTLDVDINVDTDLEIIQVRTAPGYTANVTGNLVEIEDTANGTCGSPFCDGDASQTVIRVRARQTLNGTETIETNGTADISQGRDATATAPPLDVDPPGVNYSVTKTRLVPSAIGPAPDGQATYRLEICPTSAAGTISINNLRFQDTLPSLDTSIPPDGVPDVSANIVSVTGGAITAQTGGVPNTVTITPNTTSITVPTNPADLNANCVRADVVIEYPVVDGWQAGNTAENTLQPVFNDPNSLTPTTDLTLPPVIDTVGLIGPQANPTVGKSGPGTTPIEPGGFGTFTFQFTNTNTNTTIPVATAGANSGNSLILTDNLPLAGDGTPYVDILRFTSGAWDGTSFPGVTAVYEYSIDQGTNWINLGSRTSGDPSTNFGSLPIYSTAPPTDGVTNLRVRFTTPIPPGFAFTTAPSLRFTPNEVNAPTVGNSFNQTNALTLEYTDPGDTTNTVTGTPGTTDVTITNEDDTVNTVNYGLSKSANPANGQDPGENITFTIDVTVTGQSSADLTNIAIYDVIPPELDVDTTQAIVISDPNSTLTGPELTAAQNVRVLFQNDAVDGDGDATTPLQDVLTIYWDDAVRGGALDGAFAADGTANPLTIARPATIDAPNKVLRIQFQATVRETARANVGPGEAAYTNTIRAGVENTNSFCQGVTTVTNDPLDIDNDGVTTGDVLCETGGDFRVNETASMASSKWIRSTIAPTVNVLPGQLTAPTPPTAACPALSPLASGYPLPPPVGGVVDITTPYTRFPCVALGRQSEAFQYRLVAVNNGRTPTNEYILYDILPYIGDTGVSQSQDGVNRLSQFRTELTAGIILSQTPGGSTWVVEYSTSTDPRRDEMTSANYQDPTPPPAFGAAPGWFTEAQFGTPGAPADFTEVRSFRIRQTGGQIPRNFVLVFDAPARIIPYQTPPYPTGTTEADAAETGEVAWNTFAQRFSNENTNKRLLTAEPRKVGIQVVQVYSVGNRIWHDVDDDGELDAGEAGINGVTVQLWRDTNNDGLPDGGGPVDTTVTRRGADGTDGYYLFDGIEVDPNTASQQRFVIVIPGFEFDGDDPDGADNTPNTADDPTLGGLRSSTGNDTTNNDSRDTGVDPTDLSVNDRVRDEYVANGVVSNPFRFRPNGMITNEADLNEADATNPAGDGPAGRGRNFEEDEDSDLTIDFGFNKLYSIGNRVWIDEDDLGPLAATDRNGDLDAADIGPDPEVGINGVTVRLFRDDNANGTFDAGDVEIDSDPTTAGVQPQVTRDDANGVPGYYLFDNLPAGVYFVVVDESNFVLGATAAGDGPLAFYVSSPDGGVAKTDDELDSNNVSGGDAQARNLSENGVDPTDTDSNGQIRDQYLDRATTVRSVAIELEAATVNSTATNTTFTGNEVGSESDLEIRAGVGFQGDLVTADGSELTVDMSFYRPEMSLGNRVWLDQNNNGQFDTGETGFDNVIVNLYRDDDADNIPDGAAIATTVTAAVGGNAGYYLFTDYDSDGDGTNDRSLEAGRYIVEIPALEFNGADADGPDNTPGTADDPTLANYYNSTNFDGSKPLPDPGVDFQDTSQDVNPAVSDNNDNGGYYAGAVGTVTQDPTLANLTTNGIRSATVTLVPLGEPVNEQSPDAAVADGSGTSAVTGEAVPPPNSDLTVDFGFWQPMSIGNRIWLDGNNNGLVDAGENGIGGVIVELFAAGSVDTTDADNDGIADNALRTTVTESNATGDGYYIFDDLVPGDYVVRVSPRNFQDLPDDANATNGTEGVLRDASGPLFSSESGGTPQSGYLNDNGEDNNDNGVDENLPQDNGVVSQTITLAYNTEPSPDAGTPADDTDLDTNGGAGANGEGRNGELDQNADMTVDFGFYAPLMSLGNYVFYDYDNNRIFDTGATPGVIQDGGVAGVRLQLFTDPDGDGVPNAPVDDPNQTGTQPYISTTNADGYYIFDRLQVGRYVVQVLPENFRNTGWTGITFNGTGSDAGPLFNFYSSQDVDYGATPVVQVAPVDASRTGPADTRILENGVDPGRTGIIGNADLSTNGIYSQSINLEPSDERLDENGVGEGLGPEGDGEPNVQASNSDLTQDFGFYQPMSIGNLVFIDLNDNNVFDPATESGVGGVRVNLFRDNGDGTFDTATDAPVSALFDDGTTAAPNPVLRAFDITNSDGFYLFDNLPPGNYWVQVDPSNFIGTGPLVGYGPVTTNQGDGTDNNSNGGDGATGTLNLSNLVQLGNPTGGAGNIFGTEVVTETVESGVPAPTTTTASPFYDGPQSYGRFGELDRNSDISVDFGYRLAATSGMSIGNRVWIDEDGANPLAATDRNGNIDAADVGTTGNLGINGVTVLLYMDNNGDGIPDSTTPVAKDITATGPNGDGYYLFDVRDSNAATAPAFNGTNLADADGDEAGGPIMPGRYVIAIPNAMFATGGPLEGYRSTLTNNPNGDDQTDNDDNGNDTLNATYGLLSQSFQLTQNSEASATNAPDDTDVSGPDGVGEGNGQFNGNNITDDNSELTLDFGFYQPMSIGNRVWVDNNNNGLFDAGDTPPPAGVTVTLYRETAGSDSGTAFDGAGSTTPDEPVRIDTATGQIQPGGTPTGGTIQNYTVTTDANGYYIFDNLPPGDYYVVVDNTNFDNAGDALFGYQGSNGDTPGNTEDTGDATDDNDNGLDAPDAATVGIPSSLIPLRFGTEPTGEQGSGNAGAHGPQNRGRFGETDTNSNLTIDFAVFPSTRYAIGNRVWVDEGTTNGTQDVGESGIGNANPAQGVLMRLFRFTDDATPGLNDPANELTTVNDPRNPTQPYSVTTDADGYYLFDALPAGQYVVAVAPDNFQNISIGGAPAALIGYGPTTQVPNAADADHDTDLLSDHVNATLDATFGYYSNVYTLGNGAGADEPTRGTGANQERLPDGSAETFTDGTDTGGTPIPDNRSNLTVDFGFVRTLSLGNRVWFDANADGTTDVGENGINGVQLQLFTDRDGDGIVEPDTDDSAVVATTTTDNDGYYMFNNLPPGEYIIRIPAAAPNFDGGAGSLDPYSASTTTVTTPDTGDLNDNGIDPGTYGTDPINSEQFTLAFGGAPLNENQLGNNTAIYGPQNQGLNGEADNNSDMTRDFGFTSTPYSLGNRVWVDNGAGGGTANDGNYTDGEPTVPNVTVNLFNSFDPVTGIPTDPTNPFRTVQTDANGFYRFDNIPPDEYVVQIDEAEFVAGGDLAGFSSSPGTPGGDNQDSGRDDTNLSTLGVLSGIIDLNPPPALPTNEQSSDATAPDPTGTDASGNPIPDGNSDLTVDFGFVEAFDWGDAPDTYGTNNNTGDSGDPANDDADEIGANHRIVAGLRLGNDVDDESDGAPVATGADNNPGNGDGAINRDDEEGFDPTVRLVAGTAVRIDVNVTNNTGRPANLIAWFDWNRNGVFDDDEATPVLSVPTGTDGQVTLPEFDIPASANTTIGPLNTYARFRLTNDNIDATEPTGSKASGEVEDYRVSVEPPGLSISKSDGQNSVVAGQTTTYTIIIQNSGINERNDVRFVDDIPVATTGNRDGLVGGTISWTCTATNGASCENRADPVNDPPVTTRTGNVAAEAGAGNFEIDERVDLPPGGRIVYEVTGQLDSLAGQTGGTNFVNTARLPQEVPPIEDTDANGIIFDPPSGVKTGTFVDGNIIRWTMIWYNTGTTQPGITITDPLAPDQTLSASDADVDLQCTTNTAGGTTGGCSISADRRTIIWTGTMANSTPTAPADAVIMSFNVLVPGPGTYTNVATLTGFPAPNSVVTAASAVDVGEPGSSGGDDEPDSQLEDPTIVKSVDPAFALPGDEVVWTVIVTNPNNAPLFDVSFSDNVPYQLDVLGVDADTGDVTVTANNVTWTAAIMPAGQSVSVRIRTQIRDDVDSDTSVIINTAVLSIGVSAQAELVTAFELPETGETPWWALPMWLVVITGSGGVVLLMGATAYLRYKRE